MIKLRDKTVTGLVAGLAILAFVFGVFIQMGFNILPGEKLSERSGLISLFAFIYGGFLFLLWIYLKVHIKKTPFPRGVLVQTMNNLGCALREIQQSVLVFPLSLFEKTTLSIIFVAGIMLRIYFLNQPMRYDESATYYYFASGEFVRTFNYLAPNNHVFHTFCARMCVTIFGNHAWALRLPAFVAGILSMPAIFLVSRNFFGKSSGFFAAALMAVFPLIILFDTQARGYSILNLFALSAILIGISIIQKPDLSKLFCFALLNALGMFTVPTYSFAAAGLYFWIGLMLLKNHSFFTLLKNVVLPSALFFIGLTFVFYTPVILYMKGLAGFLTDPVLQPLPLSALLKQTLPHLNTVAWNFSQGLILPLRLAILILMFWGIISLIIKKKKKLLVLLLSFLLGALLIYFVKRSIPFSRTWLYWLPIIFLLLEAGFWLIFKSMTIRLQKALMLVLMGLVFYAAITQMQSREIIQFNAHGIFVEAEMVSEYLNENLQKGDSLHMTYPVKYPVYYYLKRDRVRARESEGKPMHRRHIYILQKQRNKLRNYDLGQIISSDTLGQVVVFISREDSLRIYR